MKSVECKNLVYYGVCYKKDDIQEAIESLDTYKEHRKKYAEDLLESGLWHKHTVCATDLTFFEVLKSYISEYTSEYTAKLQVTLSGMYYIGIDLTGYSLEQLQAIDKNVVDKEFLKLQEDLGIPRRQASMHYIADCNYDDSCH